MVVDEFFKWIVFIEYFVDLVEILVLVLFFDIWGVNLLGGMDGNL